MRNIQLRQYDQVFLLLFATMVIFGFFILASASLGISSEKYGEAYYFLLHQMLYGLLPGAILFYFALMTPYKYLRNLALPILLVGIFLMFLVFVPGIGFYHGGAKRWLSFGVISFQPSELMKFAYIVYLAAWLETRGKELRSFKFGFLPFIIMSVFIASFLVFQPDIGTLGVLMISVFALFFYSGGPVRQLAIFAGIGLSAFVGLVLIEPYRLERVSTFWNSSADPVGAGYQINQALIAVGSGGLWGRGFGLSRQKFSYLPEPIGDSIFAVAAEELGFVGGISLLALFLLFFLRGIWAANRAPDLFGKLLGAGILFLIMFQALINISAIVGLLPLTGIPLPFVSYGGTASAVALAEVGIILNISKKRL